MFYSGGPQQQIPYNISENDEHCSVFVDLCEIYLSNINQQEAWLPTLRARVKFFILTYFGFPGFLAAYLFKSFRLGRFNIKIYRGAAIIDIRSELIISKPVIREEIKTLSLSTCHIPKLSTLKNMHCAYNRHSQLSKRSPTPLNTSYFNTNPNQSIIAAQNPNYLVWLLDFYFYESIFNINTKLFDSQIKTLLAIEEFTPSNAALLSALHKLRKTKIIYVPQSLAIDPHIVAKYFEVFVARYGKDSDLANETGFQQIYLEKYTINPAIKIVPLRPRVAILLSSHYNISNNRLNNFAKSVIIPFLEEVNLAWNPSGLDVLCHPSDDRVAKYIQSKGFNAKENSTSIQSLSTKFDIAICGNTSCIQDALTNGLPVAYTSSLDDYSYDLYKSVKQGYTIDITHSLRSCDEINQFYQSTDVRSRLKQMILGSFSCPRIELYRLVEYIT